MAVVLSGDGGWAGIDREIADYLSQKGIPVVGLNSLRYFWKRRTPSTAGEDLARVMRHYLADWKKDSVILIGYSLGADTLPLMADRLPQELKERIALIALLSPERVAAFEFHVADWIGKTASGAAYPVLPAIEGLKGTPMLCVYGSDEKDSLCKTLQPSVAAALEMKGGHHYGGDYKMIAETILKTIGQPGRKRIDNTR